jgi:hypothetical protein
MRATQPKAAHSERPNLNGDFQKVLHVFEWGLSLEGIQSQLSSTKSGLVVHDYPC